MTNLLLARASTRQREIAVRTALGASRARLVGQLLTETLVLYAAGACAGIALAAWGLDALIALSPGDIPRLDQTQLDQTTLAFTLGVTLVSGIVFGLVAALYATNRVPAEHLKAAARSTTAGRANQARPRGAGDRGSRVVVDVDGGRRPCRAQPVAASARGHWPRR